VTDRTRVFIDATGRRIAPFDDPIGATLILNRPLREWQAEALAEGGFDVSPTLQPPCLVVPDTFFASAGALRAFVDGAHGHDAVLVLKDSEFARMTTPVHPDVREVDGGYLFEAIRFVSGRNETPRLIVVDPRERVMEAQLPAQFTGSSEMKIGVPRAPVMTLHHWVHILWANLLAPGYEAQVTPPLEGAGRLLQALVRSRSINKWKFLGGLSSHGARCNIHRTATVEASVLGDDVTVGPYARVMFSRVGNGATVAAGADVEFTTLGEGSHVSAHSLVRFSVLYPGAVVSPFLQLAVLGRDAVIAGASMRDLNVQQAIRVELDGQLYSTGQRFLGSAVGHRAHIGTGVALATGRSVPNDYVVVTDPEYVLADIPPGLEDQGPLVIEGGTLRPLRRPSAAAPPEPAAPASSTG
jgi:carbonic anhydrase/acetyltransferase-like protein (isoleucine patch superfamily)